MKLNKKNLVIVRVWTSRENKKFPGNNVGHVSIQTPKNYMSLWPIPFTQEQINKYKKENKLTQLYDKYFMERKSDYLRSYEEDYEGENNEAPQITLCFYSLNINDISNAFSKLSKQTRGWRLIGSNLFVQKLESVAENIILNSKTFESDVGKRNVENCASLALKLLKAGNMQKLPGVSDKSFFASKTSSVVSPDKILDLIIPAKLAEIKKYPETKNFKFDGETNIEELQVFKQKSCLLL